MQDNSFQKKIRISNRSPQWPIFRQTPNSSGTWENNHFFVSNTETECDFWIVHDGLSKKETSLCPKDKTIFVTTEPESVKKYNKKFLRQFGTIVTNQQIIKGENVVHTQPGLFWYIGFNVVDHWLNINNKNYDELKHGVTPPKTRLLSVISSNKTKTAGHRARLDFISKLKDHFGEKLDVFGARINPITDKWDGIAPYKYHLAIENSSYPDYWTEKITDAYLANSYPIYYGCPNITDYFPKDSLTIIDIFEPNEAIKIIEKAIAENAFEKSAESRLKAKNLILDQYQFFPLLSQIIETIDKEQRSFQKTRTVLYPEEYFENTFIRKVLRKIKRSIKLLYSK